MMDKFIVSVDAGNGGVNAVVAKKGSLHRTFYVPSVRAIAHGQNLGLGKQFEMDYGFVDWYGHRYVVGDDVLRVSRKGIERHMGANRYGDELHQFLVAYAVAGLGIRTGEIDLTLFAPPGIFAEAKKSILEGFMRQDGEVAIHLSRDRKPRQFKYTNITVLPEGVGAAACIMYDDQGNVTTDGSVLAGDNLITDLGVYTVDTLQFQDGRLNSEFLQHATWPGEGIDTHIRQRILRTLRESSEEFSFLSTEDIDYAIRTGLKSGDYSINRGGATANIEALFNKLRQRFAELVANTIIDGHFNGLNGVKSMFLVGGGATLVADHMEKYYPGKIFDLKKNPLTRKVHPVYMNAIGGLRLAKWKANNR